MNSIITALSLSVFFGYLSLTVLSNEGCKFHSPEKGYIDLNPLGVNKAGKTQGYYLTPRPGSSYYKYYVNFCGNIDKVCDGGFYPAVEWYQSTSGIILDYCVSFLGKDSEMSIKENSQGNGVVLRYDGGESYGSLQLAAEFDIVCDSSVETFEQVENNMLFQGEDRTTPNYEIYKFQVRSKHGCFSRSNQDYPMGQYGIGGLLLTLLGVGVLIYFVGGILLLRFKFKKEGTDMIPQYKFWKLVLRSIWSGVLQLYEWTRMLISFIQEKIANKGGGGGLGGGGGGAGYGSLD